uniref:Uncharacterized protein n=2 Tax=Gossypium raimondii TaxID=29730 RepID=A0A0D2RN62_GOSRA|nr:hypothetical protein B456_011G159700 [Gossypium raimondii]
MLQMYAPIFDLSTPFSFSFWITAKESHSISTLENPIESLSQSLGNKPSPSLQTVKFILKKCSCGNFQDTIVECCPSCNNLLRSVHIAHITQQNTRQRHS